MPVIQTTACSALELCPHGHPGRFKITRWASVRVPVNLEGRLTSRDGRGDARAWSLGGLAAFMLDSSTYWHLCTTSVTSRKRSIYILNSPSSHRQHPLLIPNVPNDGSRRFVPSLPENLVLLDQLMTFLAVEVFSACLHYGINRIKFGVT